MPQHTVVDVRITSMAFAFSTGLEQLAKQSWAGISETEPKRQVGIVIGVVYTTPKQAGEERIDFACNSRS